MSRSGLWVFLVMVPALSGCWGVAVEDSVSTADFGPEDLVECRVLGGNRVYVEYADGEGGGSRSIDQGIPKGRRSGAMGETTIETNLKKMRAQKAELRKNGWDEKSLDELVTLPDDYEMATNFGFKGSEAQFNARKRELQAKLERMPSCLAQARGEAGDR